MDVPHNAPRESASYNLERFLKIWNDEKKARPERPNLPLAILRDFFKSCWFIHPCFAITHLAKIG